MDRYASRSRLTIGWACSFLAIALAGCNGSGGNANPSVSTSGTPSIPLNTSALLPSTQAVSVAGLYSASHTVVINGSSIVANDYVDIASNGQMLVFIDQGDGTVTPARNCYTYASGQNVDAAMQSYYLIPGTLSDGSSVYMLRLNDGDVVGVYSQLDSAGNIRLFYAPVVSSTSSSSTSSSSSSSSSSTASPASTLPTATLFPDSTGTIIYGGDTFALHGPALNSPTLASLQSQLCQ